MKKYKYIILLLALLPMAVTGKDKLPASVRDTADPFMELMLIEDYYKHTGDSAIAAGDALYWVFDLTQYEIGARDPNSSTGGTIDTLIKTEPVYIRVWGNKMHCTFEGVYIIQDSQYCLNVDYDAQTINVTTPLPVYRQILNVDLLDSTLYNGQVKDIITYDSIDVADGDSLKRIVWRFNNESPYVRYEITYRAIDHSIAKIEYWIRMEVVPPNTAWFVPANYRRFTWQMREIQIGAGMPYPELFSTSQFIEYRNGVLQLRPEWTEEFTLINSIDQ